MDVRLLFFSGGLGTIVGHPEHCVFPQLNNLISNFSSRISGGPALLDHNYGLV
jgi:hypothetical protein